MRVLSEAGARFRLGILVYDWMDLVFDVPFFCLLIASGYGLIPSAAFLLRGFARLVLTQWHGWTDGWMGQGTSMGGSTDYNFTTATTRIRSESLGTLLLLALASKRMQNGQHSLLLLQKRAFTLLSTLLSCAIKC
jgi:hypothetical protein